MKHSHNFKNISSTRVGRWTVLRFAGSSPSGQSMWECKCDCGNTSKVSGGNLQSGSSTSCGCYLEEIRPNLAATHRLTGTPEHISWAGMKGRCLNPRNHKYPAYGARGIKVCERWMVFENFLADMGNRPSLAHSIERKNNNGDYEPGNCIWATNTTQANNRRNNKSITLNGVTKNLCEWARHLGIKPATICARIKRGWTIEKAISTGTL